MLALSYLFFVLRHVRDRVPSSEVRFVSAFISLKVAMLISLMILFFADIDRIATARNFQIEQLRMYGVSGFITSCGALRAWWLVWKKNGG